MDRNRFQELFKDDNVIKIGSDGHCLLKSCGDNLVVHFTYLHRGTSILPSSLKPTNRVLLTAFPYNQFNTNIPLNQIITFNAQADILVNANDDAYAIHFVLIHNETDKSIQLKIIDGPELDLTLITPEEKKGILINY